MRPALSQFLQAQPDASGKEQRSTAIDGYARGVSTGAGGGATRVWLCVSWLLARQAEADSH
ncbi:hypothetical protein GCM10027345_36310 [Hymenobacter daeguensis]